MAQTLRYVNELIANFPDNSQGLIKPVHMRDFVASFVNGTGFLQTTDQITVPVTLGSDTAINPLLTGVTTVGGGWSFDGNNFAFPDWAATFPGTTIPVGYQKIANFQSVMTFEKTAGGSGLYALQWTRNGVPVGVSHALEFGGSGSQTVSVPLVVIQDISSTTVPFGVQITGVDTSTDLELHDMTLRVSDSILASSP